MFNTTDGDQDLTGTDGVRWLRGRSLMDKIHSMFVEDLGFRPA